jgi:hypothetical protein
MAPPKLFIHFNLYCSLLLRRRNKESQGIMATTNGDSHSGDLIQGLAHVNLTVPAGTLDQANDFYGGTLGLNVRLCQKSTPSRDVLC